MTYCATRAPSLPVAESSPHATARTTVGNISLDMTSKAFQAPREIPLNKHAVNVADHWASAKTNPRLHTAAPNMLHARSLRRPTTSASSALKIFPGKLAAET
mmetsp:Transcript_34686/g.79110  ORF Transcript_34686/g.79110 Transcript_34686/m.79110 type:complete len:102 (-) Transcript_34686:972-1277(-)